MKILSIGAAIGAAALAVAVQAQAQSQVPQYGPNITLEQAKKVVAAAQAEARKNGWPMAIAVVDTAGQLVYFERTDNTQTGSIEVALAKARTGAMFRRPGKALQDAVAGGGANLRYLNLPGAIPYEGGNPVVSDGKVVGGLGVSGMAGDQDGVVATAGIAVLK